MEKKQICVVGGGASGMMTIMTLGGELSHFWNIIKKQAVKILGQETGKRPNLTKLGRYAWVLSQFRTQYSLGDFHSSFPFRTPWSFLKKSVFL